MHSFFLTLRHAPIKGGVANEVRSSPGGVSSAKLNLPRFSFLDGAGNKGAWLIKFVVF